MIGERIYMSVLHEPSEFISCADIISDRYVIELAIEIHEEDTGLHWIKAVW